MKASTAAVLCFAILLLFTAFMFASRGAGARGGSPGAGLSWWDDGIEQFVRHQLAREYVDAVDPREARDAFYRAMNAYVAFDRYCEVVPPERHRRLAEERQGHYAGLGIRVEEAKDGLVLLGVLPGGPAARAGLLPGETIVAADGFRLAGENIDAITGRLKGAPGSRVRITVVAGPRPETGPASGPSRDAMVVRQTIRPPTCFSRRVGSEGRIGVIRVTEFTNETPAEFDRHLTALRQTPVFAGLVLDLRHNGGGVLPAATAIVDRFVQAGEIVRMEGRGRDSTRRTVASHSPEDLLDLPLVVLVNGRSASASEVVAGSLQDHRRGVVLGTRTYGKFLVQSVYDIPGREAGLTLTTARYYLPSGRSFQGPVTPRDSTVPPEPAGLLPDVVVDLDEEASGRLLRQWADQEGQLWGEKPRFPEIPAADVDSQLAAAVGLVEGGQMAKWPR